MKLAVCLYKYFPYGGLARDFMRIMETCIKKGDRVDVYVIEWQGELPDNMQVHEINVSGLTNHSRLKSFIDKVSPKLANGEYDLVVGFNKMPGLDLYYAADPCYIDRAKSHPFYYLLKYTGRMRFYSSCEESVFGQDSNTVSLMISDVQQTLFKKHYHTPDNRLIMLPPGIDPSRKRPKNSEEIRQQKRNELGVHADEWLLLMVGTGFRTKGVDRSIATLSSLPKSHRDKTKLVIVGDGVSRLLKQEADKFGVGSQVLFIGGSSDVPEFLLAADLLIHPARKENTGTVILESIVAGLPVLVSDVCGYTKHVINAGAGKIIKQPDNAFMTAQQLASMLDRTRLELWSSQALAYAESKDIYSMPKKTAQIIRSMADNDKKRKKCG